MRRARSPLRARRPSSRSLSPRVLLELARRVSRRRSSSSPRSLDCPSLHPITVERVATRRAGRDPLRRRRVDRPAALPRGGGPGRARSACRAPSRRPGSSPCFAHWALGLGWMTAACSARRSRRPTPRSCSPSSATARSGAAPDTILEGESGANDPVGIALMLGLIELATHADETFWVVVRVFAEQMAIGLLVGIAGGFAEARLLPRARPLGRLDLARASRPLVFGVAAVAHGSGFLAVFVAGLIRRRRRGAAAGRDRCACGSGSRRSRRSSSSSRSA